MLELWSSPLAQTLAGRLVSATLETVVLVIVAIAVITVLRIRSPRARSAVWLLVLVKPLVSLLF
jgi:hypothetical protein